LPTSSLPSGVLWHDGHLYATSHPSLWRFEEAGGKGRATKRTALVSDFNFNGNGCDIHGPFLGPDGWLYWTDGRHGYKVATREGTVLSGFAARIWRCRPDGTGVERVAGGGFDNPVELAFTPRGEILGTMDQGTGDALLHFVEGGVYPREHPCLKEFPSTGPLLGSVRQYGAALPVALCGLARVRSEHLGKEFRGALLTAQFNVHRVERHVLVRDGATFRSTDTDFITSTDHDVHLTDVLEDADGSLLFIDMGAWFNYGCPTSKIARPEVLGAIYRVRRAGAPKVADPWGRALKLATRSPDDLVGLLDDPRHRVRDQVVLQLARRGREAVGALAAVLGRAGGRSVMARRNAVWALCRIRTPEALAAARAALLDKDASVRQAAAHVAGLERDVRATANLAAMVVKDEPPLRLKAAEALGCLGKAEAVPALLEALPGSAADRFLEHSLIYALIRLNQRKLTLPALAHASPRVRQAGLLALDQMADGGLTREEVVPLLDTDDPELQQTALAVVSKRPAWSRDALGLLRKLLDRAELSAAQQRSLGGTLVAFGGDPEVRKLVASALAREETAPATRQLLLRVLARRAGALPRPWEDALGRALGHKDLAVRREAVAAVKALNLTRFDGQLAGLAGDKGLPAGLRLAALDCLAGRLKRLDAGLFRFLAGHLSPRADPLLGVAAARALGAAPLERGQLLDVAGRLADAGPLLVPLVVPAFARSRDAAVGGALVRALRRSPGAEALSAADLDRLLKGYPAEVGKAGQPLRARLAARREKQAAYLAQVSRELKGVKGDVERGRQVFHARKAACASCHRAAGAGGAVGPDLSQVGRFRSARDLLESIVFPSSSIVPEFRSYIVTTRAGRVSTGILLRDSADAVYLRGADLAEVRIPRKEVASLAPSDVSLMPEGLEKALTRQELADLLEFLVRQK
jgi:putative heme-binding domain-containing protein